MCQRFPYDPKSHLPNQQNNNKTNKQKHGHYVCLRHSSHNVFCFWWTISVRLVFLGGRLHTRARVCFVNNANPTRRKRASVKDNNGCFLRQQVLSAPKRCGSGNIIHVVTTLFNNCNTQFSDSNNGSGSYQSIQREGTWADTVIHASPPPPPSPRPLPPNLPFPPIPNRTWADTVTPYPLRKHPPTPLPPRGGGGARKKKERKKDQKKKKL